MAVRRPAWRLRLRHWLRSEAGQQHLTALGEAAAVALILAAFGALGFLMLSFGV